ncbi:MAG: hypothetical protein JST19_09390 [Bacteroidetes bacterium]|nr:hypothetical protein [Bacteroidota bacterium]
MMIKGANKRVVIVEWKRFAGNTIDVFSSLKNFCDSYPDFNYHTLNNYLSKRKIPFENDEVKIVRQPLLTKVLRPDLPKVLFWDFDYGKIDWIRTYKTIIERVLDKGSQKEWEELVRFYGLDKIIYALKNEIVYLSDITANAVCEYFKLSKPELKCYTKKQLNQGHWI